MTNSTGSALNNMTDRGMIRADAFMEKKLLSSSSRYDKFGISCSRKQ
jgi:hypothetical protein